MQFIQSASIAEAQTTAMACLLLKKFFLDARKSEEHLEQLSLEDIGQMKGAFQALLNMEEPMNLLRRKAEILCKLHSKAESYAELVQQLQQLALLEPNSEAPGIVKGKELAMYMFELLAEYHLPQEQLEQNNASFMAMFSESLKDSQTRVRAATLKAMTKFLSMFEDEEQVLLYAPNMGSLLDIVVEVI